MSLVVTSWIASILALIMFPLTMLVSLQRVRLGKAMGDLAGVAFGDGDDLTLRRRIRAFGNFVEYVPMCLIVLAAFELNGAPRAYVWSAGACLVLGRITHATGMLFSSRPTLRVIGMHLTYAAFIGPAVWMVTSGLG